MKVYFTCSARGTQNFSNSYQKIYETVKKLGHEHTSDYAKDSDPGEVYGYSHEERVSLYEEAIRDLKSSDVVLLEVSTHSLTMGYLMQMALTLGKPVIALHLKDYKPAFAAGIEDDKLQVIEYTNEMLSEVLGDALEYAQSKMDFRFNFFISPAIGNYLDWISKVKKIPRSVYLRNLIEKDMEDNDEYNS
ncbi:MAG: hypothetical protein BroJett025_01740 [Patescibacteria group bacterium]|nr:MAG: hypothetical protein BroJett025_01740 [Patescibacteria group bacterium]